MRLGGVHRRVPGHVGHVQEQRVDRVRVARQRVADHHVHQPVRGDRRVPGERLVDAHRLAVGVEQQILGAAREAERRAGQRLARRELLGLAGRLRTRRGRLRIGRLVAPAAGHIDRADQDLQQVQRAAGLEAVRMGRDAAHRVDRHRPPAHRLVAPAGPCRSRAGRSRSPARRRRGRSRRRALRMRVGRNAADSGATASGAYSDRDSARRAAGTPARRGARRAASHRRQCGPRRRSASRSTRSPSRLEDQRLAGFVAREQPVIGGAGSVDHQPGGVRVAAEIVEIDLSARSSSCTSDRTNSPSVPGRMPIHSSAIAE